MNESINRWRWGTLGVGVRDLTSTKCAWVSNIHTESNYRRTWPLQPMVTSINSKLLFSYRTQYAGMGLSTRSSSSVDVPIQDEVMDVVHHADVIYFHPLFRVGITGWEKANSNSAVSLNSSYHGYFEYRSVHWLMTISSNPFSTGHPVKWPNSLWWGAVRGRNLRNWSHILEFHLPYVIVWWRSRFT